MEMGWKWLSGISGRYKTASIIWCIDLREPIQSSEPKIPNAITHNPIVENVCIDDTHIDSAISLQ